MDRVSMRTGPLDRVEQYVYDANGNLQQRTDRKLQVTGYTYDALDRPTTVTYADMSTTTSTYDLGFCVRWRVAFSSSFFAVKKRVCPPGHLWLLGTA
jgi:YD repeat-containing protein